MWVKILLRSVPVALILAVMGYVFAEIFLIFHKMNGGVNDPANEAVRWRTPLTMAVLGVIIQIPLELLAHVIRQSRARAKAAKETASATTPR
jgi:hypothetical protein